jgi:hypothetical protein
VNLLDVTRPTRSLTLLEGAGDTNDASGVKRKSSNSIHSAFAWDAGDKAYVVIVDNVEGVIPVVSLDRMNGFGLFDKVRRRERPRRRELYAFEYTGP